MSAMEGIEPDTYCKPTYRSLMNYVPSPHFSQGDYSTRVLNPRFLCETAGVAPMSNASLQIDPWYIDTFGQSVDWNRDGSPSACDSPVRAPVNWATHVDCSTFSNNNQEISTAARSYSTPDIVRANGNWLYIFYVESSGNAYYRVGATSGLAAGSCPGGDYLGDACTTWSSPALVATNVQSLSAAEFQGKVFLAYATPTGLLYAKYASYVYPSTGALSGWTGGGLGTFILGEPELSVFYVAPGNTAVLGLFFLNVNSLFSRKYKTSLDGAWSSTESLLDALGATIPGTLGPTVLQWPGSEAVYDGVDKTACASFPRSAAGSGNEVRLYCYRKAANRWANITGTALNFPGAPITYAKVGMAFHRPRFSDGTPIQAMHAQLWITTLPYSQTKPSMGISRVFTTDPESIVFDQHDFGKIASDGADSVDGCGISLYEDLSLAALKGVKTQTPGVYFLPFADGTFNEDLRDGNDFHVMERGVCLGTGRGESWCGNSSTSIWGNY
jgi:hypothetical protein